MASGSRQADIRAASQYRLLERLRDFVLGGGGLILMAAILVDRLDLRLAILAAGLVGYAQGIFVGRMRAGRETYARFGPTVEGGFGEPNVLLGDRLIEEHERDSN